ncbi:TrlF family AAA-like ATPase [Pinibacter aurantiacus]|uniref:ATP-binding protein n=1 Tax=Pinibacter aurantiacus TaxID=2851599 RepID=A0A9E2S4L5_9BACT|nr:ATP-binding protein [Pinibacter aurantiacus]MBV4355512.1 ATP-binding protein [Pinibacter aurantiacus]
MKKGSEWRKWNFHVHTKGTNKNDLFTSSSMDDFFYTFYKKAFENQISAIGVTDYFSIDRYQEAVEYKNNIESKVDAQGYKLFAENEIEFIKAIFLFPNIELRISPATKKGKFINLHFLFNPEYVGSLANDFFNKIKNLEGFLMNEQGFRDYAKHIDPKIEIQRQYKFGLDNYNVEVGLIKDLVNSNKKLRENSIIAVSSKTNDGVSGLKDYYQEFETEGGSMLGTIKSIYKISQIIFSAAPSDKEYFIGRKTDVAEVISNVGSLKPCIIGCDAHSETDLFKKFTWVKSDLHFEGLRQICFEPEHRVKIHSDKPDFKQEKFVIDEVRFISPAKVFSTNAIHLNPNLNVIIGGKSSGKSLLLYAIAKTLSSDDNILKNDDGNFKYELDKIEQGFDFEIITKGGFKQKLNRVNENSILPEIKYIPQNYLVKLAEPELNKKGKPLNELVRGLIKEDRESKEAYQVFVNKVSQNDKSRNSQIDSFFENSQALQGLENELKTKSNKSVLQNNIKSNADRVDSLNKSSGLNQEQIDTYKNLQEEANKNAIKRQNCRNDFSVVQSFNAELAQIMTSLKQKKDAMLETLQMLPIKDYYQKEYGTVDALLKQSREIEESLRLAPDQDGRAQFVNESVFKNEAAQITEEHERLLTSMQPYLKNEEVKKAIDELNLSIENDQKALSDIDTLHKRILEQTKIVAETKESIFKIYENSYHEYLTIIKTLKDRTIELEKDGLKIVGKAQFDFPRLRKDLLAITDGRRFSYSRYPILAENKKATDDANFQFIIEQLKILFDDILKQEYSLTSKGSISNAIKIILNDYFFDFWEITYKSDKLGEMSTGKASFVILMLIIGLSKSKAPILIDQPEDNLDNRSITTDLVNYLRHKKLERQIIIVTHNANVVVNADAENVIVANQKGQNEEHSSSEFKFDYINGAIENSFEKKSDVTDILKSMGIRQHIADIVEGGKEAFVMREKKYRFS